MGQERTKQGSKTTETGLFEPKCLGALQGFFLGEEQQICAGNQAKQY